MLRVLSHSSPGLCPCCALFLESFLFCSLAKSYLPSRPQRRCHFTEASSEPTGHWCSHRTWNRLILYSFQYLFIVGIRPHSFSNVKNTNLRACAQLEPFLTSTPSYTSEWTHSRERTLHPRDAMGHGHLPSKTRLLVERSVHLGSALLPDHHACSIPWVLG